MPTTSTQRGLPLRIKRLIDVSLALPASVVTAPALALSCGAIWLTLGRPILFRQERPGRHGRIFTVYKLRTMREHRDANGVPLPDSVRLTAIGRVIRRLSLDELPQLWNVLRGEMSLVGPRPLLVRYLPRYSAAQLRRHEVLPGITGWAQINGRNQTTWETRLAHDLWYVDHWTLGLDLRIVLTTLVKVLSGEGISQRDGDTMPEFMGQERD
jgi:lipopolysaccharide/colanic/teichoic acid biosynthesis glycosyltransferase